VLVKVKELGDQGLNIGYNELVRIIKSIISSEYNCKHKDLKIPPDISVR